MDTNHLATGYRHCEGRMTRRLWMAAASAVLGAALAGSGDAASPRPVRARTIATPAVADRLALLEPDQVRLNGYVGARVSANERNRLLHVEETPILAGFRVKPGSHPWIGEHVGKWLHAATLAWVYTGDAALRRKLDRVVAELVKSQEADGYLGTYTPDKRFGLFPEADWDVWSHKYNLLGLLTYYRYTGDESALGACRKMGDLLTATFGPGKKSILAAGTHVGMASTSVLEPMVLLHRYTGEPRYLEFAEYLVKEWDAPKGPRVLATLLNQRSVGKTANGKAYEMLSNIVGLCELYRTTGKADYLTAARNAWDDVVRNQLYVTGSASSHELFHGDHELPNGMGANVGETCVTVTWIQLTQQLLRLTGEAKYADEWERSLYNHLMAAQRPDGAQWCYYTSLDGTKPYGPGINCCVSSGPRGMALTPGAAYLRAGGKDHDTAVVSLYEPSQATLTLGGQEVALEQATGFPRTGGATLTVRTPAPAKFALRVRRPAWAEGFAVSGPGRAAWRVKEPGWWESPVRSWKSGERVRISFDIPAGVVPGDHGNAGKVAFRWGPMILAYDQQEGGGAPPRLVVPVDGKLKLEPAQGGRWDGRLRFTTLMRTAGDGTGVATTLVPFAFAGETGGRYQVWLRAPGSPALPLASLFGYQAESRSRSGNVEGSVADEDPTTFVVTFNARPASEDWYQVTHVTPQRVSRIVYAHGKAFHDGGWFVGPPRLEYQAAAGGPWLPLGPVTGYPATTAADSAGLREGQLFTTRLKEPVRALAIRVIGTPAHGDNPAQAFSSCAELQAYAD